jgi:hypothetical protein
LNSFAGQKAILHVDDDQRAGGTGFGLAGGGRAVSSFMFSQTNHENPPRGSILPSAIAIERKTRPPRNGRGRDLWSPVAGPRSLSPQSLATCGTPGPSYMSH